MSSYDEYMLEAEADGARRKDLAAAIEEVRRKMVEAMYGDDPARVFRLEREADADREHRKLKATIEAMKKEAEPMAPRVATPKPKVPMDSSEVVPVGDDELEGVEELDEVSLDDSGDTLVTESPKKEKPPPVEKPKKAPPKKAPDTLEVLGEDELALSEEELADVPAATGGLADEITPAGEERDWRKRLVVYGFNGTGKTRFLDDPQTLIANSEDGTTSIADKPKVQRALQIPVRGKKKLEQLYWYLKQAKVHPSGKGLVVQTKAGEKHIDHLAFDTASRLIDWVLREQVLGDRAKNPEIQIGDISLPQRGKAYEFVKHWMVLFRDMPLHITWLCQEREPRDNDNVPDTYVAVPDLPPSVRGIIQGDVDVVGHTEVHHKAEGAGAVFMIRFGANPLYPTKDRFNVLPNMVKHTTFRKLLGYIEKKQAERSEEIGE